MSRHYPHLLTNHGNNYKASDGPRDQQNKIITSDPARYSSKDFSRNYSYEGILRYESHDRPRLPASSLPLLPPPNLKGSMPEGLWRHTTAQIEAMEAENTRLARRPAEGFEPSGRRPGESTRTAPKVNGDSSQYPKPGHGKRKPGIKPRPAPHANRSWSHDEEAELLRLVRDERNYEYMAQKLGRTSRSCETRWWKIVSRWPEARGVVYNPR